MNSNSTRSAHLIKLFSRIFLILIILFIIDFGIGKLLKGLYFTQVNGGDYRLIYAISKSSEDIIILGDSRAQHHYIPTVFREKLNLTCFNAGRAGGQSIIYHYAVFRAILDRYHPKLFIINISPSELLEEANRTRYDILSILEPFAEDNPTIRNILELRSPFESLKLISKMYPYNSKIISMFYHNPNRNKDDNGYIPRNGTGPLTEIINPEDDTEVLDYNKLFYLFQLVSDAKKNDVKILFVISPQYFKLHQNSSITQLTDLCRREKIEFLDYSNNQEFMTHKEYYNDDIHLNHHGAGIFSAQVAEQIELRLLNKWNSNGN
jgi:mRNA-degrading endonuclease RelE of RelBE toxin-antitoxin system